MRRISVEAPKSMSMFGRPHILRVNWTIVDLLPFSSYRERQTFFRVVTRLKHSSLYKQTVAF